MVLSSAIAGISVALQGLVDSSLVALGITYALLVDICYFLRATAATALARLSHRSSVCPSVCPSVTRVDQSKTVQAMITKSSLSAAWKTLVSGSVKIFHKFERGHPKRGR